MLQQQPGQRPHNNRRKRWWRAGLALDHQPCPAAQLDGLGHVYLHIQREVRRVADTRGHAIGDHPAHGP